MSDESVTTLYRPVGQKELDLIAESGFLAFPPRLLGQPIFYPVLTKEYATRIAQDWNTRDKASGFVGYVLQFQVRKTFLDSYEIKTVGSKLEQEYWIPADQIPALNENLVGPIKVIAQYLPSPAGHPASSR
ncbi:MAG TPA: hypothetical protein VKF63_09390 [Terracidiphilus sp.]|nr:hypothetical protein [Terracidiphilus sp.]